MRLLSRTGNVLLLGGLWMALPWIGATTVAPPDSQPDPGLLGRAGLATAFTGIALLLVVTVWSARRDARARREDAEHAR